MKILQKTLPLLAVLTLSGCYVHFQAPTPELTVPLNAESAERAGAASCRQVLWVFAMGDCSVKTAMQSGNIQQVHHVDSEVRVILWGAFSELTIRAWGQ